MWQNTDFSRRRTKNFTKRKNGGAFSKVFRYNDMRKTEKPQKCGFEKQSEGGHTLCSR